MAKRRADYDSPWKEMIELLFPQFIAFFFPVAFAQIDWSRPPEFLDKELQRVVRRAKTGRHVVDKLVKVWLKDGVEIWVLIHIEVQGQVDGNFEERMYIYGYRLYDRYKERMVSLAILGDDDPDWRPQSFGYALWGYEVRMRFPTVKLFDYAAQWPILEQSDNPFAVVVMVHLKAQATRRYPKSRLRWKIEIVKGLYGKGFTREQTAEVLRFIDWIMDLPEKYELQFEEAIKEFEEAGKMKYIMTIERRAMERGKKEGKKEGKEEGSIQTAREALLAVLMARFSTAPQELIEQIHKITDLDQLKTLLQQAAVVGSLEQFEHTLETSQR